MANAAPAGGTTIQNPFAAQTGPSTPDQSDGSRFGLSSTELATSIDVERAQEQMGTAASLYPGATNSPSLDPFGIGVPIQGGVNGHITVQDLLDYIQQLPPSQLAQVQSELANAGFYGMMNTVSEKPTWGVIGNADLSAISAFARTVINGTQSGSSIQSILQRSTQQFSVQQQQSKSPVQEFGKNYTITNLDPKMAQDMVDQVSMEVIGHTLDDSQRAQYANWLNQQYTSQQMTADQGDISQNNANAVAQAQYKDQIDPATGRVIAANGVVSTAQSQLGVTYVWGGEQPNKAFDCSGLAQWVYGQNGYQLPRTSQAMWNTSDGTKFSDMAQAQPGDLVFFGGDGTGPTHVGIYIGNGMMIDAPHTGSSVRYDNVQQFGQGDSIVGFKHFNVSGTGGGSTAVQAAAPTGSAGPGGPPAIDTFMAAEKQVESGGDYTVTNSIGAGGAYQMLPSTWNQYAAQAGFSQYVGKGAAAAPPDVQDAVASFAFRQLYAKYGNWHDVAQAWFGGPGGVGKSYTEAYAQDVLGKMQAMGASTTAPGITTVDTSGNVVNLDTSMNGPAGTDANGAPTTGAPDANGGRTIESTPNTFTQVTDASTTALQAELAAKLRADHPDEATGADWANAYNMLKKAIDPAGFGVENAGSTTTGSAPGG